MTRSMIVFPTYIGQLFGVTAIELGTRKTWIHTLTGKVEVSRFSFKPDDLDPNRPQSELVIQASRLAYPR